MKTKSFLKMPKLSKLLTNKKFLLFLLVIVILIFFLMLNSNIKEALTASYCNSRNVEIKIILQTRSGSQSTSINWIQAAYNGENITEHNNIDKQIYSHGNGIQQTDWVLMEVLEACPSRFINEVKIRTPSGKTIKYENLQVKVKSGNVTRAKTLTDGSIPGGTDFTVQLDNRIRMRE